MGYVQCIGPCAACKKVFAYNPDKVPSLTIDGERKPFCRECIEHANVIRKATGYEPIVPLPGAYGPADENEIDWSVD
jgi:hypothetical protein